jgi:ribosome-binding factor A
MEFSRVDRLQSQIQKEISDIVANELRDTPPAMITFTRVEVTRDLKYSKVYFSAFGADEKKEKCAEYLKRHAGAIRYLLGRRVRMRILPEFTFYYDASIDHVMRINEILEKIKKNENQD